MCACVYMYICVHIYIHMPCIKGPGRSMDIRSTGNSCELPKMCARTELRSFAQALYILRRSCEPRCTCPLLTLSCRPPSRELTHLLLQVLGWGKDSLDWSRNKMHALLLSMNTAAVPEWIPSGSSMKPHLKITLNAGGFLFFLKNTLSLQ